MTVSPVKTVFLKELRDLYRDRRTLMVTVVLPLLMYPIIFIGVMQLTMLQAGKMKEQTGVVAVLTPESLPGNLLSSDSTSLLDLVDSTGWQEKLKVGEIDAAISITGGFLDSIAVGKAGEVSLHYLSSRDFSVQVKRRIENKVDGFKAAEMARRMNQIGVDTSYLHPVSIKSIDEATQQEQAGSEMGRFLGYFLILTTLTGAFYAAIDLTAGEKERGTLETLLVSPALRQQLVYGKFLATVVAALLSAVLNLVSMGLTTLYAVDMLGTSAGVGGTMLISPGSVVLVLLTLLPLAVLFAGVTMAVAVTARTYKEGQGMLTPLMMISILPAMVSMIPGIELSPLLAVIPIANVSLLMRALLAGNAPWLEFSITILSTAGLAALSLRWVTQQFNRESVLFRHAEDVKWSPFTKPVREVGKVLTPTGVAMLTAVAVIVVGIAGGLAKVDSPFEGILIVQGALALLSALWVYKGGFDPVPSFGWRMPAPISWLAVVLAVAGGWVLTVELATLQHMFFPFPEDMIKQFTDLFSGLDEIPTWQALLLIAVLPAFVEEHLCRGLMLRGITKSSGMWPGIITVALIFAFLHLNPYRLLPTFSLGILLGYIAIRTNSIFPAILGHFMNNSASVLIFRFEDWFEKMGWAASEDAAWVPWPWLFIGTALLLAGLVLLPRSRNAVLQTSSTT